MAAFLFHSSVWPRALALLVMLVCSGAYLSGFGPGATSGAVVVSDD